MAPTTTIDILQRFPPRSYIQTTEMNLLDINTLTRATGPLTELLYRLFNDEQRRSLRILARSGHDQEELIGEQLELQKSLEETSLELMRSFRSCQGKASEAVAEALGPGKFIANTEGGEDEPFQKRKFFSFVTNKSTEIDYAKRIAQMFRLLLALLDDNNRNRCNFTFLYPHQNLIRRFQQSVRGMNEMKQLILGLLQTDGGITSTYNKETFCILPIAHLISANNLFTSADSASKTISAIKYLCRGCVLKHLVSLEEGTRLEDIPLLKYIRYNNFGTSPFANLVRIHSGINAFPKQILERVRLTDQGTIYVDGVDFGPRIILRAIRKSYRETISKLAELLLGHQPSALSTPSIIDNGNELHCAFGQSSDSADGRHDLLNFILSRGELRRRFFTRERRELKRSIAKRYFNDMKYGIVYSFIEGI